MKKTNKNKAPRFESFTYIINGVEMHSTETNSMSKQINKIKTIFFPKAEIMNPKVRYQ